MGFNATLKKYRFVYDSEDDQYQGLEFVTRGLSIGEFSDFTREMAEVGKLDGVSRPGGEEIEKALNLYVLFAPYLVSWNVEIDEEQENEDGEKVIVSVPVPPTLEGMRKLDTELVMFIVASFIDKVVGVSGPLVKRSLSGPTSQVASLPMDVSSASRAS